MTNPNSISLQDLMYAYYKAAYPGTANEPGSVTVGQGVKTQGSGGGGSSNVVITGPVDGSGNVKVAIQGTVPVSGNVNATITGPLSANGSVQEMRWQDANKNPTTANSGNATAPAANTNIAVLPLGIGYWRVRCVVGFGGVAEATAIDNFKFLIQTVNITLPVANQANTQSPVYEFYVNVTAAGNNAVIENNVAGSATSVYKATIMAEQVG